MAQAGPYQRRTLKIRRILKLRLTVQLRRTLMAFSPLKGGHGAARLLAQAGPNQRRTLKLRRTLNGLLAFEGRKRCGPPAGPGLSPPAPHPKATPHPGWPSRL
jgi:hypothetical protein